ncbi:hypothetical protein JHU80_005276, partial [Escherichia coli]|nr:hypothetical protein [Escherichia coli]
SSESYLNWHLNLNVNNKKVSLSKVELSKKNAELNKANEDGGKENEVVIKKEKINRNVITKRELTLIGAISISLCKPFVSGSKKLKLINNPEAFFNDSRSIMLNKVGKLSFK